MNKKIFVLFILLLASNSLYSQVKNNFSGYDKFNLTRMPVTSDENQIKSLVQSVVKYYKQSFKYFLELKNGSYKIEKSRSGYNLIIYSGNKIKDEIEIQKTVSNDPKNYILLFNQKQFNQLIDKDKFKDINKSSNSILNLQITQRNDLLIDKEILNLDENHLYGKILNKTQALDLTVNQYGEGSTVWSGLEKGIILPYNGGANAKVVTIDNLWHSSIYFSRDNFFLGAISYGSFGNGDNNFFAPTSCVFGRGAENIGYTVYPVYFADRVNNRVTVTQFYANDNTPSGFDPTTFQVFANNLGCPYDVGYFYGRDMNRFTDRLWISESHALKPALTCYNRIGNFKQRVVGYKLISSNQVYPFLTETETRLSVYSSSFEAIAFIDNVRNCLVIAHLDGFGEAYTDAYNDEYVMLVDEIVNFPNDYCLNSVSFHHTSGGNIYYPYLWVTSGYSEKTSSSVSMIHAFKVGASLTPQYLGSTQIPSNSDANFTNLKSTIATNGYFDIFTTEKWSDNYGIRKYFPYVGIYNDTLKNYCLDSTDRMKWVAQFTNDCYIQLTAEMQLNNSSWQSVSFKQIGDNHYYPSVSSAVVYQWAGNSSLDVQLDLPLSYYIYGGQVRLHAQIFPEYESIPSGSHISKDYQVAMITACLPKPGGCPFLYINDTTNSFRVDNNILHRSEFTGNEGVDILDKYKVQVKPLVDNNSLIQMAIVENENDLTSLNEVKLYYVDHPYGTKVGITENLNFVYYDSSAVISTDDAILNQNNITQSIQYNNSIGVKGYINDIINAHYPLSNSKLKMFNITSVLNNLNQNSDNKQNNNKTDNSLLVPGNSFDSLSVITYVGNLDTNRPVSSKNYAGTFRAFNNYNTNSVLLSFARRENLSEVIVPAFRRNLVLTNIDSVSAEWSSDFKAKYISVVPVHYNNNYTLTEINLSVASLITQSDQTDVTEDILKIDDRYAYINSSSYLLLKFDASTLPSLQSGYTRDFVFESIGQYSGSKAKKLNLKNQLPLTNQLYSNYPNPFNPTTTIKYDINNDALVKIKVFNVLGQEVMVLVNENKKAGKYSVVFDGSNLASGIYFYRFEAGDFISVKKMVLIK